MKNGGGSSCSNASMVSFRPHDSMSSTLHCSGQSRRPRLLCCVSRKHSKATSNSAGLSQPRKIRGAPVAGSRWSSDGAEATVDLPFEKIQYLKAAYDFLKHPFKHIIVNQSPDWIITDWAASWTDDIARECSVSLMMFSVFSAATSCFVGPPKYLVGEGQKRERATPESLASPPMWVDFPSSVVFLGHEAVRFHAGFYGENASGTTDAERVGEFEKLSFEDGRKATTDKRDWIDDDKVFYHQSFLKLKISISIFASTAIGGSVGALL
ncbi:hypothetical protein Nepgr_002327 [Nepenthes gracilis]|uniref:Uncharacterized protein n=1 Tax=Nepenthes gracilis TaxID=150966 RepID=A0AAD3P8N2_NEPGR|nr:hypothetical protein Nepgr_002327 [Nepenthes gracilis]